MSTRGDYASRALLSLALHADESGPTSVRDIAERTGLPQPYLEQILLALKGAGLVRSKRGVGGGYVLARPPSEISLSEIVSAVDGPIVLGDFGQPHTDGACDHEGQCVLLAIWSVVGDQMRTELDSYTLADIAAQARGERPWPTADVRIARSLGQPRQHGLRSQQATVTRARFARRSPGAGRPALARAAAAAVRGCPRERRGTGCRRRPDDGWRRGARALGECGRSRAGTRPG